MCPKEADVTGPPTESLRKEETKRHQWGRAGEQGSLCGKPIAHGIPLCLHKKFSSKLPGSQEKEVNIVWTTSCHLRKEMFAMYREGQIFQAIGFQKNIWYSLYVKDSELLKGQFFNNDFSQETEIFSQGHLGHQTPQGIISQFWKWKFWILSYIF